MISFKRQINPKEALRVGRLSNRILLDLKQLAKKWNFTQGEITLEDREFVDSYTRIPPTIAEIVYVWIHDDMKFILYDELIIEDGQYGMDLKKGDIFPWIFKIKHTKDGSVWRSRDKAIKYLEDLTWHQEVNF